MSTRRKRKNKPVAIESGIPIRLVNRKKKPFMLDIVRGTIRKRFCYATLDEAKQAAVREAGKLVQEGLQAVALTRDQRLDAERAIRILGGNITLEAAASFYMKHTATGDRGKPSREVITEFLASKKAANRRPATLRDAEHRLNTFATTFGDRPLGTITLHELERWIATLDVGPVTRLNFRTAIVGLFRYGIRRGLTDSNPAEGLPRPGRDQAMPEIFTPNEVRSILTAATNKAPEMIPYFTVGFFAGLRPQNELAQLDWRHIDLKARTIRVDPATAKKRRMRFVKISPNLKQWLAPYARAEGKLFYSRRLFRQVIASTGLTWSPDVMRHSFGSYHLAAHGDAAKTALELGHAGAPGVLFDHYRALARRKDATDFWQIKPQKKNIIQFPALKEKSA